MKAFFKTLGAGVLYTILSPIFLAILALAMVLVLVKVAWGAIMIPICFFNGKNYLADPEARLLAQRKQEGAALNQNPGSPYQTPFQTPYQQPVQPQQQQPQQPQQSSFYTGYPPYGNNGGQNNG